MNVKENKMTQHSESLDFIIRYENGECDEQETIEGFQLLIDSGLVWQLQGSYGRMAASLIQAGICNEKRH